MKRFAVAVGFALVVALAYGLGSSGDGSTDSAISAGPRTDSVLTDPEETTKPVLPPKSVGPAREDLRVEWLRSPVVDAPAATVVVEVRHAAGSTPTATRRRFARSSNVVAIQRVDAHGVEIEHSEGWWFARNPVDPRQFSAVQVLTKERVLLDVACSDLLEDGVARGFGELVQLGISPKELAELVPAGTKETAFGLLFERLVPDDGARDALPIREVWWNEEWKLPLRVVRVVAGSAPEEEREETQEIVAFEPGVNVIALVDPGKRNPGYARWDRSDWLENLECHAGNGDHAHGVDEQRSAGAVRIEMAPVDVTPTLPAASTASDNAVLEDRELHDVDEESESTSALEVTRPVLPPPGIRRSERDLREAPRPQGSRSPPASDAESDSD